MKSYEVVSAEYVNEEGKIVSFECYRDVPIIRKVNFINFVLDVVVVSDKYYSILRDLVFDFALVDVFTDIDTNHIYESPNSISQMENFIDLGIADVVKTCIDKKVLTELNKAVDDAINYKTGNQSSPIMDAITDFVNTLNDEVKQLNSDEMINIIKNLGKSSENITTDNILQSYAKSEMFGKTVNEIQEQRDKGANIIQTADIAPMR